MVQEWVGMQQGLTSHSTHFRPFRRRWVGYGISHDCSHSQSPQNYIASSSLTVDKASYSALRYYSKFNISLHLLCVV